MSDNPSFFNRWSQRKADSRQQSVADDEQRSAAITTEERSEAEAAMAESAATESDAAESATPEPELTDADMPALEQLDSESDFAQFFSPGVSQELRNLALRKLFLLPEFNLRDGLNDYDDDFSKMPELTQAVIDKLRNWINEEGEAAEEELKQQLLGDEAAMDEAGSAETVDPPEEDDLGDADLEG